MRDPIPTERVPPSVVQVAEAMLTSKGQAAEARTLQSLRARSGVSRRTLLAAVGWMEARDIAFRNGPEVRVLQPAHWLWWLARTNRNARLKES